MQKLLDWDEIWYSGVFGVTGNESELNIQKFKMSDRNVKSYLIRIIFGTRAFLRSPIMNPSWKFRNQIQILLLYIRSANLNFRRLGSDS